MKIIKNYINKILGVLGFKIIHVTSNPNQIEKILRKYNLNLNEYYYLSEDEIILNKLCDLRINPLVHEFIIKGYSLLKELYTHKSATISYYDNKFQIQIDDLKININTWEEIFILKEIFIEGTYNLYTPFNQKIILFDIGMNVGFTSLFFAKFKDVDAIYSYEPFKETFDLAKLNFELNQDIASKIHSNNYGLGDSDRQEYWEYNAEYKGSMGANGRQNHIPINQDELKKIKVDIRDVSEEIKTVISGYNDSIIILKIDCEGGEFEIFNRLKIENIFDKIDIIMMEWHQKGPKEILNILLASGFNVLSFNENNKTIGMIYAFK